MRKKGNCVLRYNPVNAVLISACLSISTIVFYSTHTETQPTRLVCFETEAVNSPKGCQNPLTTNPFRIHHFFYGDRATNLILLIIREKSEFRITMSEQGLSDYLSHNLRVIIVGMLYFYKN